MYVRTYVMYVCMYMGACYPFKYDLYVCGTVVS